MNIYGIKDSANFTVKYKSGVNKGKVFVYADYATVSTNEWTSEQVYAKSKNVNAIRWDYGRASTLKVDMEIFDLKWIGMLFGSEFVTGDKDILKREVATVGENNTVALPEGIVEGSLSVYVLDDDGLTNLSELTVTTSTVETGKYKMGTDNKSITVHTDIKKGDKLAFFYLKNVKNVKTLTINADEYPENFEIFADTMMRATDGNDQFVQINYLNVKPKSQFTLTMDASNITTMSVEYDILKDTSSSDMATYSIIAE